jgi:hypothetical protein
MKGFVVKVWEMISEIKFYHRRIHRRAIIAGTLPVFSRMGLMT